MKKERHYGNDRPQEGNKVYTQPDIAGDVVGQTDNRSLDHTGYSPQDFGYAVFGRVLSGMEVADRIAAVATTTTGGMENVPVEPVVIKSIVLKN